MPPRPRWITTLSCLALAASVYAQSPVQADTLFRMNGDPGDWITGGASYFFTPEQGTFSGSVGSGAALGFSGSGHNWTLNFAGVGHRALLPGLYSNAVRYPFQSANSNGLSVDGDGRGCNTISGTFVVRQAVYGPGNTLTRFWVTFEQHCEAGVTAARGEFRFNADTSVYVVPPADVWLARAQGAHFDVSATDTRGLGIHLGASGLPTGATFTDHGNGTGTFDWTGGSPDTATVPVTFQAVSTDGRSAIGMTVLHVHGDDALIMTSDAGDYIGQGLTYTYDGTNAVITASKNYQNGVSLGVTSGDHWWYLDFAAPGNLLLHTGVYPGATRYPFNAGAGLSVYGDGRGCNTSTGSFEVKQVVFGAGSSVQQFWATFEQHCEGQTPALRGEIRIGVDLPTAVAMSLVSAEALPGHNRLEWFGPGTAGTTANVERRAADGEWNVVAPVVASGDGRFVFDDNSVPPGSRLGYRLAYVSGGATAHTPEVWLTAGAVALLALDGLRPNPAREELTVSFGLPDASLATLDMVDLAGRRVLDVDLQGIGAGSHVMRIGDASRLPPGTYWLRLRQGGQVRVRSAIVVR